VLQTLPSDSKIHNSGRMACGVQGMLCVTVGDAGNAVAQELTNVFGTVLRRTEDGDVPSDNPFIRDGTAPCRNDGKTPSNIKKYQDIYSYELINHFALSRTHKALTKSLKDIGGTEFPFVNCGWPVREGPCAFSSASNCDSNDNFEEQMY
jgi:Glucose / Sorbosone dehydrogenase